MKHNFLMGLLGATAMVGMAIGFTGEGHAAPIIQGNSANLLVSGSDGGVNVGLEGTVLFQSVQPSSLKFVFNLTNTSQQIPSVQNENRVTAFGFSLDGTTVDITDAEADGVWSATTNVPGGSFLNVDVCVYLGETCTGGGNTGLFVGANAIIGVTLTGTFEPPLELTEFGARFQSTGPKQKGSLKLTGTVSDGTPPPTDVPEPASLALFGVGLLGLGYAARRRRQAV